MKEILSWLAKSVCWGLLSKDDFVILIGIVLAIPGLIMEALSIGASPPGKFNVPVFLIVSGISLITIGSLISFALPRWPR